MRSESKQAQKAGLGSLRFRILLSSLLFTAAVAAAGAAEASTAFPLRTNPFTKRTAGVFEPLYPTVAAQELALAQSPMSTFLWYAGFASGPQDPPHTDLGGFEALERLFKEASEQKMMIQFGYEPNLFYNGKLYSLHLGTLVKAFDTPDFVEKVLKISHALEANTDPLAKLAPRKEMVMAQVSYEGSEWALIELDLNTLLVNAVKWAHYLRSKQNPILLRPLSEMNDDTAGSWCFKHHAENTPQTYASAWVHLFNLTRLSGATNATFVFAPLAYDGTTVKGPEVADTLRRILALNPRAIQALGVNTYAGKQPNGKPFSFETAVKPWLALFQSVGLKDQPLVVPEMGINRVDFPEDKVRADWIRDAFRKAKSLGFRSVTYFHGVNPPMDFTVTPRSWGAARSGEADLRALQAGIAEFQN